MILDKIYSPDPRVENEAIALKKLGHQVFLKNVRMKKKRKISNGL